MNVDKFGHYIHKRMRLSELFEINDKALLKSESGDFDLKSSRLKGIRSPEEADEVVNKDYVDRLTADIKQEWDKIFSRLRLGIAIDVQNTVKNTLKANTLEILTQLEDKFYTKSDIDKFLKNGKAANS